MAKADETLPLEFGNFKVDYVVKKSTKEYSSSCPNCGGSKHRSGEKPDRCVWFTAEHPSNKVSKPHGWCRRCGKSFWPDNDGDKMSAEDKGKLLAEREERAREAQVRVNETLALLASERRWEYYHQQMQDAQRAWWEQAGVPIPWQNYWKLGYCKDKIIKYDEEYMHVAAYTIPKFDCPDPATNAWRLVNMDYRLETPPDPKNRYRHESDLPPTSFLSQPSLGLRADRYILVEGSKKAMVIARTLFLKEEVRTTQVIGLPGVASWGQIVEDLVSLKLGPKCIIMPDPDTFIKPANSKDNWSAVGYRLQETLIGSRLAHTPLKPDDMIVKYGADRVELEAIFRQARSA